MSPIYIQRKLKVSADGKTHKGASPLSELSGRRRIQPQKRPGRSTKAKVIMLLLLGMFLSTTVFVFYTLVMPAQRIYNSAQTIATSFNALSSDLEAQDLTKIDQHFFSIQVELDKINHELSQYEFLDDLSFTKGYYQNLQVIRKLSDKSKAFIDKALPEFKVVLKSVGYQVDPVNESAELAMAEGGQPPKQNKQNQQQLNNVIRELPSLIKFYEELEPDLIEMSDIFNELNPKYIPSVGSKDYAETIRKMQKVTKNFPEVSADLKQTVSQMPQLLGANKPVRYLVLLQNEKEMRATGGILSAHGVVTVRNGEVVGDIEFTDSWGLAYRADDLAKYGLFQPYYNKYGQLTLMLRNCGAASQRFQDAGDTPDLYDAIEKYRAYYDAANRHDYTDSYPDYDHVVIFNTFFVSDMLSFVDPINVKDEDGKRIKVNSKNVAMKLFGVTSKSDNPNRKSYIGDLGKVAMERLTKMDAGEFPQVIAKFIESAQGKNIAFVSKDPKVQAYFDKLGLSGRIERKFNGDYFALSEAQNCALKANFYVDNRVEQNIHIDKKGNISKKVNIRWSNDTVYNPKIHYNVITTQGTHLYRAWIRVMTPPNTEFTYSDGYEKSRFAGYVPQTYYDEQLNKQVSDNIIWYDYRRNTKEDPATSYDLNVEYTLAKGQNYNKRGVYRMLIQKHPGKRNEKYIININHAGQKTSTTIRLDRDKVVTYRDGVIMVENYDQSLDQYLELLSGN